MFSGNFATKKLLQGRIMFFWPYHFVTYGPHTGPQSLWLSKEKTHWALIIIRGHMIKSNN